MRDYNHNELHFPGSFYNLSFFIYKKLVFVLIVFLFLKNLKDTQIFLLVPSYILESISFIFHSSYIQYVIAGIIQKYFIDEDWKNVLNVRYLSLVLMVSVGVIFSILFYIGSFFITDLIVGHTNELYNTYIQHSLTFLIPIFIIRPILTSYRSYYTALMEDKLVQQSYFIEIGVSALISILALLSINHFFNLEIQIAIYMIVCSFSIGALGALYYMIRFDRKVIGDVARASRQCDTKDIMMNTYLRLLVKNSAFYILPVILYFFCTGISYFLLIPTLVSIGTTFHQSTLIYGLCFFLSEIPMVLMLWVNMIVNQNFIYKLYRKEDKNLSSIILKLLEASILISLPIAFILGSLSTGLYDFLFDSFNITIGKQILISCCIFMVFNYVTYVSSSILIALNHKKKVYTYILISFVIKAILYYTTIQYVGVNGIVVLPCIACLALLYLNLFKLHRIYHFNIKTTFIRILKILLSIVALNGLFGILRILNFKIENSIFAIQFLEIIGIILIATLLYCFIISAFKLVEGIYDTNFKIAFKKWNQTE